MADLTAAFGAVADASLWEDVTVLFAGFVAPTIIDNVAASQGVNAPDEAGGVAVILAAYYALDGNYQRDAMLGGGLYTADALTQRLNVKSTITSLGA